MRSGTFAAVLAVAAASALGAVAANVVVGGRLFERTVVENPYEAGLRYDEERRKAARPDCAISAGRCQREAGGAAVTLEIAPRPVRAMADLDFTVTVRRGAGPVRDGQAEVLLTMPGMYMGENRVQLSGQGDGSWRGKGLVVRCPSGGRTWTAEVVLREPGAAAPLRAAFTFELAE